MRLDFHRSAAAPSLRNIWYLVRLLGRMTHLAALLLAIDSEDDADRATIAYGAVALVLVLGCLHGNLLLRAERFGRGLRMGALVQQIRQNCFSEDIGKAGTHKEILT